MKYAIPLLLATVGLLAQDADPARALINSDFVAAVDAFGTRPAQTNLSVVYLDTTKDDQFIDLATLRADTTFIIRGVTPATAPPEVYAKALARALTDKYPQIAGLTVSMFLSFNTQGTPQFTTTLTRLAPALSSSVKKAVAERLSAHGDNAQSRIVR